MGGSISARFYCIFHKFVCKIYNLMDRLRLKSCSLGMKQRIGIAMALLGDPALLILDEPINGLDTDGMRIMREILVDITQKYGCTVLISSHILGELEKIATHYGMIRQGRMIQELSAEEMDGRAQVFVSVKTKDMEGAKSVLHNRFADVRKEDEAIRVYDVDDTELIVEYLLQSGHDYKSGYVKQLFTTHAKKQDYMLSKSLVSAFAMASMCMTYLLGSVISGVLVGASFEVHVGSLLCAFLEGFCLPANNDSFGHVLPVEDSFNHERIKQGILAGKKTATVSIILEDEQPLGVGDLSLVLDGRGNPACVIKTVYLETVKLIKKGFTDVKKTRTEKCIVEK